MDDIDRTRFLAGLSGIPALKEYLRIVTLDKEHVNLKKQLGRDHQP